jgi:hypothetical protein
MHKFTTALAALALSAAAFAQSNATQQVQLLAPQLVPFSGSSGNFGSLVTGLTTGAAVTLATVGTDGSLQIVTFTPGTVLSALDAARLLEAARQSLIVRGVVTPSGQQIAASLMGGTIATLSGNSAISGVLTGSTTSPTPVQVRTDPIPPQSGTGASNLSAAQLQAVRNALASGTGVTLTMNTGPGTAQNVNFAPIGVRLSDFEADQALQLAAGLLAQQGILNPTADQLRVALFGGTRAAGPGTQHERQSRPEYQRLAAGQHQRLAIDEHQRLAGHKRQRFARIPLRRRDQQRRRAHRPARHHYRSRAPGGEVGPDRTRNEIHVPRPRALAVLRLGFRAGVSRQADPPRGRLSAGRQEAGCRAITTFSGSALYAPAGTPAPVVRRMHEAAAKSLANPEMKEKIAAQGMDATPSASPEAFEAELRAEAPMCQKLVRDSGAKVA